MLPDSARGLTREYEPTSSREAGLLRYWRVVLLGCLFVFAAAVRMIDITGVPRGFFTDEASFGLNADLILHTARDEHGAFMPVLFKSFGEYKLPAFIYAEVPFMAIFGRTELAVRLTAAVVGSLSIITTYLLAKELFRRELPAFAAAATLAALPWHIHYSRTGLGDIAMLPLFFSLGFYLFFRAMRDVRYLLPAALVLAATFYTYRGGWLVLPPVLFLMAIAYRRELLRYPKVTAVAAVSGFLVLLPLILHLALGPSDRTDQAWIFNIESEKSTLQLFGEFYRSYFTWDFLFAEGDHGPVLRHYLPGHGELYYVQIPLIIAGVVALCRHFNRSSLFILALVLLYPLSASVSDTSPISSRAILGSVAFSLLTAAGVQGIVGVAQRLLPARRTLAAAAVLTIVAGSGIISFGRYTAVYHDDYPLLSSGYWGWQDGPQEIIAVFRQHEADYDEMYMSGDFNAPDIFFDFYVPGACGNCHIGGPDHWQPELRQLFAIRAESLHGLDEFRYHVVDTVQYPGGSLAFVIVEITGRR